MLIRRKKSASILIFGIAIFTLSFTFPRRELWRSTNTNTTNEKSLKTTTIALQGRFDRRHDRGKTDKDTVTTQVKTQFKYTKRTPNNKKVYFIKDNKTIINEELPKSQVHNNYLQRQFPTVIILGVKKAGTRALLEALQMHPKVVGAPNEVYFFNGFHTRGLEWYRQKMPLSSPDQITIEKSPTYFTSVENTQVVHRMFVFSRSTRKPLKLLVVVRDPAKRCLSEYTDLLARSRKNEIPAVHETFESFVLNKNGSVNADSPLVKTGLYIKHLTEWLEYFPPDELHFVSGEGLVKNPYKEIKAVETFLGLETFFTKMNFKFVRQKAFPCFVPDVSDAGKSFCLPPNKGRQHVQVQTRTLRLLREFYQPFNKQFYAKVRRNFNWP